MSSKKLPVELRDRIESRHDLGNTTKTFCCIEGSKKHLAPLSIKEEIWNNQDSS